MGGQSEIPVHPSRTKPHQAAPSRTKPHQAAPSPHQTAPNRAKPAPNPHPAQLLMPPDGNLIPTPDVKPRSASSPRLRPSEQQTPHATTPHAPMRRPPVTCTSYIQRNIPAPGSESRAT